MSKTMKAKALTKTELEARLKAAEQEASIYREVTSLLLRGEKPVPVRFGPEMMLETTNVWAQTTCWVLGGHRHHGGLCAISPAGEDSPTYTGPWMYTMDWTQRVISSDYVYADEMHRLVRKECNRQLEAALKKEAA